MPGATEVVISGIAGRFPECNSTEEFKKKLYNNEDLLTDDNRRWAPGKFNEVLIILRKKNDYGYHVYRIFTGAMA